MLALGLAGSLAAWTAPAQANSAAVDYFRNRADRSNVPTLLSQDDRAYYRDLFGAIERSDWAKVQDLFKQKADGPLHQVALAEYYLAPTSPKIELDALSAWLAKGTDLPQAEQIALLAQKRGATALPALPQAGSLVSQPNRAKRIRPRETNDGTMPGAVAAAINSSIKDDNPAGPRPCSTGSTPSFRQPRGPNGAPRLPGRSTSRTTTPRPMPWPRPCRTVPGRGLPKAGGPPALPPGGSAIAWAPAMPLPAPPVPRRTAN